MPSSLPSLASANGVTMSGTTHGHDHPGADLSTAHLRDPWTTLGSREVYGNPWIRVREDEVLRPDGSPGIYGVVEMSPAVGVVALTDADEVVLVGQWRYTLGEYCWELVEGGAHDDEDVLSAAKRELAEEAGFEATHWEQLGSGRVTMSNSVTDEVATLFLARGLTPVLNAPDPTEELEVRLVPVTRALELVDAGVLDDVLTVVGLLTLDRRRRRSAGPDGV